MLKAGWYHGTDLGNAILSGPVRKRQEAYAAYGSGDGTLTSASIPDRSSGEGSQDQEPGLDDNFGYCIVKNTNGTCASNRIQRLHVKALIPFAYIIIVSDDSQTRQS